MPTTRERLDTIFEFQEKYNRLNDSEKTELQALLGEELFVPPMRLAEFVQQAWHVVEPETAYLHNWHIDAICEHLEASTFSLIQNLIINIAPRHMKSLLVSVFWPVWVWTFMPQSQWLFVSHSLSFSTRDSLKRRRIIESDWYKKRFGSVFSFTRDQRRKAWFENNRGGHMIASGLTGMGLGADFIVGDDLLDGKKSFSAAYRLTANQFWGQTIATRGNNPKTVVKVMIAQRLHYNDPPGHVMDMEREGGAKYEKLILPTEFEPSTQTENALGWVDPRTEPGQLIWPERFDSSFIKQLKISLGSNMASSQLQQRPSAIEGAIINKIWFRTWTPPHISLPPFLTDIGTVAFEHENVILPDKFDEMVQSWDCTFKDADSSDYVVGGVWGRVGQVYYLLDIVRRKMDIVATITAIQNTSAKWPRATKKIIEEKANGAAVIRMLKAETTGLTPYNPTDSKAARLNACAPKFQAGHIVVPHPHYNQAITNYINEICDFPFSSHDDQVDMTTQIILHWQRNKSWTRS